MSRVFGPAASAAFQRAADRAREVLKPGDRVTLGSSCGGGKQTVTFAHWSDHHGMLDPSGRSFSSLSLDDLSPWNITKVNGHAVNFRDAEGIAMVEANHARFDQEAELAHATRVQHRRQSMRVV